MTGLLACAPVIDNRGYVFDESLLPQLKVGTTSQTDIITLMGSPSTASTLNGGAYYYISSKFITEAYRAPRETERRVLAIFFDEDKKVRDLGFYTLEDGNIVTLVERTTETQGANCHSCSKSSAIWAGLSPVKMAPAASKFKIQA